jgi:WD40 repeat protein
VASTSYVIDFSPFITDRTRDFVGRDWVFAKIDTWLADRTGPRIFFLAGGPGSGKSAVAARLVQMSAGEVPSTNYPHLAKDRLAFFYFCQAQIDASLVPQRWIESLAQGLANRYPIYAQVLAGGAFAISGQALDDARAKGVPEPVLNLLASLQNISVVDKEELLPRIQTLIGEKAAREHRQLILDHLIQRQTRHPSIEIHARQTVGPVAQGGVVKNIAIESLTVGSLSPRVSFDQVVRFPLQVLCGRDFNETILVLVDGLDEALTYGEENLVTLIADASSHSHDLPVCVRFLFTGRPDPRIIHAIGKPSLNLIDDAPDDVDDVGIYIDRRLRNLPDAQRREWATRIARAGSGNFLYARHVLDDRLDDSGMLKSEADLALPKDLQDVYRQFLKRELGRTLERWSHRYQKLLGVIAVSRGDGLTSEQLANVTGLSQSTTDSILHACSQYLAPAPPEGPFRLYHESFREFLLADRTFRIYPGEAHFAIAGFYTKEYKDAWSHCDEEYALLHTLTHLIGSFKSATRPTRQNTMRAALTRFVTNLSFLERKAERIGIDAVRSDLSSVTDVALLDAEVTAVLKSILYILDWDANILSNWDHVRHPHFFVNQIYLHSARLKAVALSKLCEEHLRRMESGYLRLVWMSEVDSPELERTLVGSRNPVVQLAATPDGQWIVSQTNVSDLIVWHRESGREMHRLGIYLRNAWQQPTTVALTQDSRYAILEEPSYGISVWDLQTGKNLKSAFIQTAASWTSAKRSGMWPLDQRRLLHWDRHCWRVLDTETLQPKETLNIPAENIAAAAVVPDGRQVILGTEDGAVQIWDLIDGQQIGPLRTQGSVVRSIGVTPNGRWMTLSTQDKTVEIWDLQTGCLKWTTSLLFDSPVVLSPEGDRVVFAREDFSMTVWNVERDKAEITLRGHAARINDIFMILDGDRVLSAGADGTVRIWNIANSVKTAPLRPRGEVGSHTSRVTALTITPDGKQAISGSIDGVKIWNIGSGITEKTIASQDGWVDEIAIRAQAHQVVVVSSRGYGQLRMTIVDASEQEHVQAIWAYRWSGIRTAGVYDRATWQAIRSASVNVGDMEEFTERAKDPARTITPFGVATSATPLVIVDKDLDPSAQADGFLTRFENEGPARDIHQLGEVRVVGRILVSDGRLIYCDRGATGLYGRLWDYESEPQTIRFESGAHLEARALTADGRFLILALEDGALQVFDLQTRQTETTFSEHKTRVHQVLIAPDDHTVVSFSEDAIGYVWDLHTAQQKLSCRVPRQAEVKAITGDSRRALVASRAHTAVVEIPLEIVEGAAIRTLDGHTDTVHEVAVSPDGDHVLSASEDRTIKLWSFQSGQQLASATLDHPARCATFGVDDDLIIAGDAAGNVYCLRYSKAARSSSGRGPQRKRKRTET